MLSSGMAYVFVVGLTSIVSLWLFDFYGAGRRGGNAPAMRSRASRWEFSAQDLGGFSQGKLALASVFGLFLEMMMIRWVSSEIRIFAYFKNFVLIACFLGFGLGCYLVRRRISLLSLLLPLSTLAVIIKLPWTQLRDLIVNLPGYIGAASEVNVWGVPYVPMGAHSLVLVALATHRDCADFRAGFLRVRSHRPIGGMVSGECPQRNSGVHGQYRGQPRGNRSVYRCFVFCSSHRRCGFCWPELCWHGSCGRWRACDGP